MLTPFGFPADKVPVGHVSRGGPSAARVRRTRQGTRTPHCPKGRVRRKDRQAGQRIARLAGKNASPSRREIKTGAFRSPAVSDGNRKAEPAGRGAPINRLRRQVK